MQQVLVGREDFLHTNYLIFFLLNAAKATKAGYSLGQEVGHGKLALSIER